MGTPLGPKYILYSYMEPLGNSLNALVRRAIRCGGGLSPQTQRACSFIGEL